jgi:acetyl-CoA acetyltransferase
MNDAVIIGVGLHPFGRFDKTAMEMGAEAIQSALTDAGVDCRTSSSASAAATRCPTRTR